MSPATFIADEAGILLFQRNEEMQEVWERPDSCFDNINAIRPGTIQVSDIGSRPYWLVIR